MNAYRALAEAVVADALTTLRAPRQSRGKRQRPTSQEHDAAFFLDPRRSAFWCEMAGFDWKVVVEKLRARKLLSVALLASLAACDATITTRVICRGDTTAAVAETSLVKCSTLDTLARR